MGRSSREPERTCVGCRTKAAKRDLLRVVRSADGSLRTDPTGAARGRGAYLHPSVGCVDLAMRKGTLARALRTGLGPDGAARLRADIEAEIEREEER